MPAMMEEPRCAQRKCRHLLGAYQPEGTEEGERPCCEAFPEGIPEEIAYGDNPHTSPYPGDHGIRYEREEEDVEA